MNTTPASRAASAAGTALIVFGAGLALLILHTSESQEVRPFVVLLCSLAMAVSGIVHLFFVGLLAKRHGRAPARYVFGALFTLPVGSAVALALYEWFTRVDAPCSDKGAA